MSQSPISPLPPISMVAVGPDDDAERAEWIEALTRTIDSNAYCLGREVEQFEKLCSDYLEVPFAFGVNSGTDAIRLGLQAVGVKPGDEVIAPALSFFSTASSIAHLGAKPVFVDVREDTLTLDPVALRDAITDRTRAVIPVHLYGQGARMDEIQALCDAHEVAIVEDAAQCFGARYQGSALGSIGGVGCFSFYPTKNLGAPGDAGMMITRDPDLADRLARLRVHGDVGGYCHEYLGWNARMDGFQGAVLAVKLRRLPDIQRAREANVQAYLEALASSAIADRVTPLGRTPGSEHTWHQFIVRVPDRDRVQQALRDQGIPSAIYYPGTLPQQPAFGQDQPPGAFPVAEEACRSVLALPVHHRLEAGDPARVIGALAQSIG